jgi:hypothetical protein
MQSIEATNGERFVVGFIIGLAVALFGGLLIEVDLLGSLLGHGRSYL